MKYLLLLYIFCLPMLGFAQEYLGNDRAFFEKKARLYQRWLDRHDLGEQLRVDSVKLAKNGYELELILRTVAPDEDYAANLFLAMQREYVASPGSPDLASALFATFARFMEIPPAQGNVQIYYRKPGSNAYSPCFYVWIWEENGRTVTEEQINNCKAQNIEINIPLPQVDLNEGEATGQLKDQRSSSAILADILAFARQKYEVERVNCEERNPTVLPPDKQNDYYLKFVVNDLCREVLTDEEQSLWCDFVEFWWGPCNDMRRERLEFEITLNRTDDAYLLFVKLTGKFGSGIYRPRESSWMDMEPDFEVDFLAPYARAFKQELQAYLTRK